MGLLSKLFGSDKNSQKGPPSQEVEVRFSYGSTNFQHLFALEDVLGRVISEAGIGHYEGHDVDEDGSDGCFYLYGTDAEAIYRVIGPVLSECSFMSGATVTLWFGPRKWKTRRRTIELPS